MINQSPLNWRLKDPPGISSPHLFARTVPLPPTVYPAPLSPSAIFPFSLLYNFFESINLYFYCAFITLTVFFVTLGSFSSFFHIFFALVAPLHHLTINFPPFLFAEALHYPPKLIRNPLAFPRVSGFQTYQSDPPLVMFSLSQHCQPCQIAKSVRKLMDVEVTERRQVEVSPVYESTCLMQPDRPAVFLSPCGDACVRWSSFFLSSKSYNLFFGNRNYMNKQMHYIDSPAWVKSSELGKVMGRGKR